MAKYLYTIRIEFDSLDDIEARKIVTLDKFDYKSAENKITLQEIFLNKPPRKVEL